MMSVLYLNLALMTGCSGVHVQTSISCNSHTTDRGALLGLPHISTSWQRSGGRSGVPLVVVAVDYRLEI